jgi:hypothetical protein
MTALASGDNPERMGIDLRKVLCHAPDYVTTTYATSILEDWKGTAVVRDAVCSVSLTHLASVLAKGRIRILASHEAFRMLWNFYRLQLLARQAPRHRRAGVREAFFDWLDPVLRDSVVGIYTHHFSREPRREHLAEYERSRALTLRATSSLE